MLYQCDLITELAKQGEVIIYGAGVMGTALMRCLRDKPYHLPAVCFLVMDMEGNPGEIEGTPVLELSHGAEYRDKMILVALHEKYMEKAMEELRKRGFSHLVPVSFDSDLWSGIRGNWLRDNQSLSGLPYVDLEEALDNDLHVYVVHSVADKALKEESRLRGYEIPIQVGASLAEMEMFPVRDSQGENISDKNPQYCELTALYWIWKHDRARYVGLSHYRRRFEMTEEQVQKLLHSDIDVVTTVPVLNFAGVGRQYCCDHEEKDWNVMREAVRKLHPEYMGAVERVQNGIAYYAYNMFIARREILSDYCQWLFPILSYCEEEIGTKTDKYQNRYIGFLAERLLTIYLVHNKQYKLAVARKHFFESI